MSPDAAFTSFHYGEPHRNLANSLRARNTIVWSKYTLKPTGKFIMIWLMTELPTCKLNSPRYWQKTGDTKSGLYSKAGLKWSLWKKEKWSLKIGDKVKQRWSSVQVRLLGRTCVKGLVHNGPPLLRDQPFYFEFWPLKTGSTVQDWHYPDQMRN